MSSQLTDIANRVSEIYLTLTEIESRLEFEVDSSTDDSSGAVEALASLGEATTAMSAASESLDDMLDSW